ncbi:PilZ domain-containing protein [Desulfomicrobium salsuginis]
MNNRRSLRRVSLTNCVVKKCHAQSVEILSRSINYNATGCMLEMDHPFDPGDVIKIQFANDTDEVRIFGKDCCLGMVRWCRLQVGICGGFYAVGVELMNQSPRRYV